MTSASARASIADAFAAVLDATSVRQDENTCTALSGDIYGPAPRSADVVLAPKTQAEVVAVVETARRLAVALFPRGGGYSYTGGYRPEAEASAIVDMRQMRGATIGDGFVTAAAGTTWGDLYAMLNSKGLRVPSFGPLSGHAATVGGSLAQNGSFFGAAAHGSYADETAFSSTMVDGTGAVVTVTRDDMTDGTAWPQPLAGDCGAFGIRTTARLATIPRPTHEAFASFHFASSAEAIQALVAMAELPGLSDAYLFDPGTHANLVATGFSLIESAAIATDLATSHGSWWDRLGGLVRAARAGKAFVADLAYSLHLTFEGAAAEINEARSEALRRLASMHPEIIPDVIPRATRAKPFRPIKAVLGPAGERWLPLHGVFPKALAPVAVAAVERCLAEHAVMMTQLQIRAVVLAVCVKDSIIVEPQLFWPDALSASQRCLVQPKQLTEYGRLPENLPARQAAHELRRKLIDVLDGLGARHYQIGRTYCAPGSIPAHVEARWQTLKGQHDPQSIMNPGVLGLARTQPH